MRKKKSGKKTLLSVLFLVVVLVLTFASVLHGEDIPELIKDMAAADGRFLLLAVLCVLFYLVMQGVIFRVALTKIMHEDISLWHCILISFHGYFYCSVTPFQSGGPPIQIVDLKKEGMRYTSASIVVIIVSFLYKLVLCVIGVLLATFGFGFLREYLRGVRWVFAFGLFLTIGFTFLIGFFFVRPDLTKRLTLFLIRWAEKKHIIKHKEGRYEFIADAMDNYQEAAGYFRSNQKEMTILFFLTLIQRTSYFAATWFVYKSFGLSGISLFTMILLQASVNISADMLPLPGGAGVSEALYSVIFKNVFPASMLVPGLMLTRGITYYVQIIVCGIFTVVAMLTIGKKHKKFLEDRGLTELDEK